MRSWVSAEMVCALSVSIDLESIHISFPSMLHCSLTAFISVLNDIFEREKVLQQNKHALYLLISSMPFANHLHVSATSTYSIRRIDRPVIDRHSYNRKQYRHKEKGISSSDEETRM